MNIKLRFILTFLFIAIYGCSTDKVVDKVDQVIEIIEPEFNQNAETNYFPPTNSDAWETVPLAQLEWDEDKANDLYDYLEEKDTKGFMILYKGRIVTEKYFNGHNTNATWTWYSAAKSLTATFVGIAQDEGHIDINAKTSDYLGANWSSLSTEKQDLITVKNHLSMTTGLTDYISEPIKWICKQPGCLEYTADAGTRWAYHQGAFMLLQDMITASTGMSFQEYCKVKVSDKIGMVGNWTNQFGLNIYNSNTRSMARFGLLSMNKGKWDNTTIVNETYFDNMTNSSQDLNKSYGFCWWLNGKESFLNIGSDEVVPGSMTPNAPADMFSALGSQDQKIYVVPSLNLVVVRCGDRAGESELGTSSFDNILWGKINEMIQ